VVGGARNSDDQPLPISLAHQSGSFARKLDNRVKPSRVQGNVN